VSNDTPSPIATSTLRETCVLVDYHGGFTNWKKRDAAASKKFSKAETHNEQSYTNYKNTFAGCDTILQSIKGVINEARGFHYSITLPAPKAWGSAAIISNALVPTYRETMTAFQQKLDSLKVHLKNEWDAMLAAAASNLGTAYDPSDYDDVDDVLEGCYIDIDFRGVPSAADIAQHPTLGFIKDALQQQGTEAYDKAIEQLWLRLLESVQTARDQLSKLSKEDGRFRTEWIENMRSLLPALKGLNINGDPKFEQLANEASFLLRYDESTLKTDIYSRKQLRDEAQRLFDKLSGIYQTKKVE